MTGPERVMAAITGAAHDRPPFGLLLSLYGSRLAGTALENHFRIAWRYVEAQERVLETFHPDILFGPFALALLGEAWGSQLRFQKEQAPNVKVPAVCTLKEFLDLPNPDMDTHPTLLYFRECVRGMTARLGKEAAVAMPTLSAIDFPIVIFGLEAWLEMFLFRPQEADQVIEKVSQFAVPWCQALMADGASCLVMPVSMLTASILPFHLIEARSVPLYKTFLEKAGCPTLLHHVGARILPSLLQISRLSKPVLGVVADARDPLGEVRSLMGPDRIVGGGIEGSQLNSVSMESIRERTRLVLADRQDDPHFIFCTTGADVPLSTDVEQIHTICRTIESFSA